MEQLSFPRLEPASGAARVEAALLRRLGRPVRVELTDNRSRLLSSSVRRGVRHVRAHAVFAEAPDEVLDAAAEFLFGPRPEPASAVLGRWVAERRARIRPPGGDAAPCPKGEFHDLERILLDLDRRFFAGKVGARITWSRERRRRRSIQLGAYVAEAHLIRVHPALDQAFVPEVYVAFVVFHELLHAVHGAESPPAGRRRLHTAAFRRDEARFPGYGEAKAWEARHIHQLFDP